MKQANNEQTNKKIKGMSEFKSINYIAESKEIFVQR